MRRARTDAIVLQTFPSRERDKLVVFLTPDHGKRKGWAYGARSGRSRYGASLELLSKIRIGYFEKDQEEAVRIESVDLVRSLFDVHGDLKTSLAATYIAETIDTFSQSDDPSELTYRLLDRASEALLETRNAAAVVASKNVGNPPSAPRSISRIVTSRILEAAVASAALPTSRPSMTKRSSIRSRCGEVYLAER